MVDVARIQGVLDQLRAMSAADMKAVEKFGKVKGYSAQYLDLKESMRALLAIARNVDGIDLESEFAAIEPIVFMGMIPNEHFNNERKRVIAIGERLMERIHGARGGFPRPAASFPGSVAPGSALGGALGGVHGAAAAPAQSRIYLSDGFDSPLADDVRRCLVTADCVVVNASDPRTLDAAYTPLAAIDEFRSCQGAVILLLEPTHAPDGDLAAARTRLAKNVIAELGIALGRFADRTFFVVDPRMISEVPQSMQGLISFQPAGAQLTFDEGQRIVQAFKAFKRP